MKPEQLYQELKDLAEKLGMRVAEQSFRSAGIRVRSGFCVVRGQGLCIIDKHLKISRKTEALGECLSELPHETVYVIPAVREYLERFKPQEKATAGSSLQPMA